MTTPSLHRFAFIRRALAVPLLSGCGLLALNGSLQAQQTATFTNGGTPANTGMFNNANSWSTGVIPTSTTTTSDTATFDGTGGGATAGTPLVLTDTTVIGGAGGNQGVILNLTAGQAGGLTLSDSGSVRLAAGAASTSAAPTTAVTMAAGAGPLTISSILIGGTTAAATFTSFVNNSSSTLSATNLQPGGGNTRTLNLLGTGNYAFTGAVQAASNTLNIVKGTTGNADGTGTLTLSAANTYTGITTINAGIVSISNSTALGAAGTATNTGTAAAPTFTNVGDTVLTSGTNGTNNGQLNLVGGTGSLNVGETFVFNGRNSVANASPGTVLIDNVSGTNTLSGTLNFSTGGTDYGIRSDAGTLTIPSTVATITPNGGSKTFDFYGAGGVVINANIADTATGMTSIARPTGSGAGTLTLGGANTYTGTTAIAAGIVLVTNTTGSATGTGAVNVTAGSLTGGSGATNTGTLQTLGTGNFVPSRQTYASGVLGIISGTVTASGAGNIAPGNGAVGTLTVGALTLNAGATLTYEFNNTANDFTAVGGALTIGGTTRFTLLQEGTTTAFQKAGIYNLFSYGTGSTITTTSLQVANQVSGLTYTFVNDTTDSLVQLDITGTAAVPEPSTWVGCVLGLGMGTFALRRRIKTV